MSDFYYSALNYFYRLTDRPVFSPLHFIVRKLYQGPLHFIVKIFLFLGLRTHSFEVIFRHSVKHGKGFNAFASDVDVTFVAAKAFNLAQSDQIRSVYHRLKTFLPMLGELEIFSKDEWRELQNLWQTHGETLQLIRDLKKMRWMEWKLEARQHIYHASKAKRAILKTLEKYEQNPPSEETLSERDNHRFLGKGFCDYFKNLVQVEDAVKVLRADDLKPFYSFSREFDNTVGSDATQKPALHFETGLALCLLSLVPSHGDETSALQMKLNRLRQTPQIRPLHTIVLKYELLYANASPRVHIQFRSSSWQWTESLLAQLQQAATPDLFGATLAALTYHRSDENGFLELQVGG